MHTFGANSARQCLRGAADVRWTSGARVLWSVQCGAVVSTVGRRTMQAKALENGATNGPRRVRVEARASADVGARLDVVPVETPRRATGDARGAVDTSRWPHEGVEFGVGRVDSLCGSGGQPQSSGGLLALRLRADGRGTLAAAHKDEGACACNVARRERRRRRRRRRLRWRGRRGRRRWEAEARIGLIAVPAVDRWVEVEDRVLPPAARDVHAKRRPSR